MQNDRDGKFLAWWVHKKDDFSVSDVGGSEKKSPSSPS